MHAFAFQEPIIVNLHEKNLKINSIFGGKSEKIN